MQSKKSSIPATLLLFLSCGAYAITPSVSYTNPKLVSGDIQIRKACVMPVESSLRKVGMKGGEGMSKESEAWSSTLQGVVETHLKSSGVDVISSGMSAQELEKNEELRQVVVRLQQKYDSVSNQLERHPKDTKKGRFSVGDEVNLLPCASNADTLVYAHGKGQVLTGGKKAMGILVGGAKNSTGWLTLSFVDAKTGDILAFVRMLNDGKFVNDSEKAYGNALNKQFKKLKLGSSVPSKKSKR